MRKPILPSKRLPLKNLRLSVIVLAVCSCITNNAQTPKSIDWIEFGSGGGFTGVVTKYTLDSKGQLSKKRDGAAVPVKKIGRATLRTLFRKCQKIESYQLNSPGNMYSFITIKTATKENHLTWGSGPTAIDASVLNLYNELMALTR